MNAQPDDGYVRFRDPCGFGANDSLDVDHDGDFDLVVHGIASGTDDEPSSSGVCVLHVSDLPGTKLLCSSAQDMSPLGCAWGDTLPPVASEGVITSMNGIFYARSSIPVASYGYGHQAGSRSTLLSRSTGHYVFLTMHHGRSYHGWFTIHPSFSVEELRVHVGTMVAADQPLIIR